MRRTTNWQLNSDGGIRRPKHDGEPEHCPLSYAGNAKDTEDYKAGGRNLGFNDDQSAELARISDSADWRLPYNAKLRRILLKAARLQEKEPPCT